MYYLLRGFIFANKASYPSVLFDPLFITALTENEITLLSQTKIHTLYCQLFKHYAYTCLVT